MRNSRSHVGRFVLALLATFALVLLINQAQGQSSHLPETLDAHDVVLRNELRAALSFTDTPCLVDPVEDSVARWCGDLGTDAGLPGVFPLVVALTDMTLLANDLVTLQAEDRTALPGDGELYIRIVSTPDLSRAYLVAVFRLIGRAYIEVERLGVGVGHGN